MLIFGGMVIIGLQAVTVFHTSRTRSNMQDLIEGIAHGLSHLNHKMESIEQIPEILGDLNLGAVQLMPQKSLGEIIMEKIMERMSPIKNIDPSTTEKTWPAGEQPENPPLESVSEA